MLIASIAIYVKIVDYLYQNKINMRFKIYKILTKIQNFCNRPPIWVLFKKSFVLVKNILFKIAKFMNI